MIWMGKSFEKKRKEGSPFAFLLFKSSGWKRKKERKEKGGGEIGKEGEGGERPHPSYHGRKLEEGKKKREKLSKEEAKNDQLPPFLQGLAMWRKGGRKKGEGGKEKEKGGEGQLFDTCSHFYVAGERKKKRKERKEKGRVKKEKKGKGPTLYLYSAYFIKRRKRKEKFS